MNDPTSLRLRDALRRAVDAGAPAEQLADTLVATWREIDGALRPVIGQLGVSALYQRSVTLTMRTYPWLSLSRELDLSEMDLDALHASVSAQSPTAAADAGHDMLVTLTNLLSSLVGASLADRLLRPVDERNAEHPQ